MLVLSPLDLLDIAVAEQVNRWSVERWEAIDNRRMFIFRSKDGRIVHDEEKGLYSPTRIPQQAAALAGLSSLPRPDECVAICEKVLAEKGSRGPASILHHH